MKNSNGFLNELRQNKGAIWVENDAIHLYMPKRFQNPETNDFIKKNRNELISVLTDSRIFSEESFLDTVILKNSQLTHFPLSPAQERLWFIEQYEEGTNAYHIPAVFELENDTDIQGIRYALQQVVARHEILRTTIESRDNQEYGIQVVHDKPLDIEEVLITDEEDLKSLLKADINRPFDLRVEYPVRVKFYTFHPFTETTGNGSCRTLLLINMHHIASDGWSIEIFQKELTAYYEAFVNKDCDFRLPALDIQYKDYAAWQKDYLTGEILEKQLDYWREKLSGYQTLELPTDYVRPRQIDYKGAYEGFAFNQKISKRLRALAWRYGTTLHSVLLSGLNILLGKYTGQEDIVTGSPTANRHHRQTEGLIGFFVNTQVNRALLNKTQSFESLIQQVHQDQVEAQLHQDLPFEKLIVELGIERDASRNPIFQVMFGVQSLGNKSEVTGKDKKYLKPYQVGSAYETTKFDLSIFVDDSQECLTGYINYATSLFHQNSIKRFIDHYTCLLEQLTEAPAKPYSQFSLLRSAEYDQIVYEWNATGKAYPKDKTLCQLFEEQAERTPGNLALVYEGQQLTYKELNERSNQLARHIRVQYQQRTKQELKPDTLIALFLDRSLEMVVGILAVLKAGGAYVPIDTNYPPERINYILEDTRAELVLSQTQLGNQLPPGKLIYIDLSEAFYNLQASANLRQYTQPTDLAYVMYTSGTTGEPKGVLVEHAAILSLVYNDYIKVAPKDVFAFLSSPVFDAATFEIWTPLLQGNRLVIPKEVKGLVSDIDVFKAFIKINHVSILWLTKTLFESIYAFDAAVFRDLSYLLTGGEALDRVTVNRLAGSSERPGHFLNGYGPTESTTFTCIYEINSPVEGSHVPIGKPISNRNAYILDAANNPVPVGVIGELYIGGAGLARGYLNRPELTKERFIPNPFATQADREKGYTRLYKTGDLVRWLADGNIEFIGRNDDQVKIRGYRIELGEIEQTLAKITGIKQSCVLAKERKTDTGSTKYLAAYYVTDHGFETLTEAAIVEALSKTLPEYMVPAALVVMASFPLTINGKLDKQALPDPDFSSSEEFVAPTTETETAICNIWKSVLGLEKVGITDNFFRIGGDSILSIQVSHLMSKALGCDVKVADIFRNKTISQLLVYSLGKAQISIPKAGSNPAILSFAQERLWFIEQYEQGTNAYHIPVVLELEVETEIKGIKYALQQVVSRHEILRTTIEQPDKQEHGIQIVHNDPLLIEETTLTDQKNCETLIKEDINRPFDLSVEYPLRVKFYHIQAPETVPGKPVNRTLLLINMHHIASDGWSIEIFQKELFAYYEACINNDRDSHLPAPDIQYKDYAVWQRTYLTGEVLEKQLSYWKEKLSAYPTLELPTDYLRPNKKDYRGSSQQFIINNEISGKLRALAQRHSTTLHSVLLSSMNILLSNYTAQEDIITGSLTANRHHRQTEGLIGFFVNTQVNRALLSKTQSFESLIQQVHQDQIEAQLHQDLPFEKLIDELGVERDPSRHPVFQVMFGVQSFGRNSKISAQQKKYLKPYLAGGVYEVEKFDLTIFIDDSQDTLIGYINYATSLFQKETIAAFIRHYIHLLEQLTEAPGKPYRQISLLTPEESSQIIYQWNDTHKVYPRKNLVDICLASIKRETDSIAVVDARGVYSYRQIGEYSYHLAGYLHDRNLSRTNCLIGVLSEKGYQQVVATLGIMQSGAAYLPLHVDWPIGRIDEVLMEGNVHTVLVSQSEFDHRIKGNEIEYKYEWKIIENIINYLPAITESQLPQPRPEDIAYVIFTSGSTGKPKGVIISHWGAVNTLFAVNEKFEVNKNDKVLALSELSFDLSVYDIFGLLAAGGTVIFPDQKKTKEPEHWYGLVKEYGITIWDTVPQLMQLLVDYATETNQQLNTFKVILMSGDWIPLRLPAQIKNLNPETTVMSLGGATEGSIWSIWYEVKAVNPGWKSIPYGSAMPNQKMYVLNEFGEHCAAGLMGEIHIGGEGVALGYWNDESKTNASFFVHNKLGRVYKTGDLGKWNRNGYIEFQGRKDGQVKIHGHRIELGEIEQALSEIRGIKHSCVLVKERKTDAGFNKYLVAYYVFDNSEVAITQASVLEELSKKLPEYMLPVALIEIESFPLSSNGKLDRGALPEPDFKSTEEYIAPRTEIEEIICRIWQGVLGLQKVGITDNFFRIGGDSILSIQVSSRIRQAGFNCQVKDIFECRTIDKLAEHLIRKNAEVSIKSEQGTLSGDVSLLPIQQWFWEKVSSGEIQHPNYWNQSFLVKVPQLDTGKLDTVIRQLVSYHDVFRVQFPGEDGPHSWKQTYQRQIDIPELKTLDISKHPESEVQDILGSWQSGFNLQGGPLFQAGYLYGYPDGSARIFFALHHMIVDAVSWRILADDTRALYEGKALPPKGSSYRQWVDTVNDYANRYPDETTWWEDQLRGMPDYDTRGEAVSAETEFIEFDRSLTGSLLQNASKAYRTEINDLLLTALAYALQEINHQDIQGITLEGHGREDIDATIDHSRTVGWFTSMFPVRLELQNSLRESIQYIKDSLRSIPNKGIGFGVFATANRATYTHQELPSVSFNYLGQFDSQEGYWQIVAEGSGNSMHPSNADHNLVNINAMVSNGRLGCSIATRLGKEKTRQLGVGFKTHLTKIIEHCLEKLATEGSSYTPGDFKKVQVSQVLLDRLQSEARASQNEILHIYPATSLQQGFIYHVLSQSEDDAYRIQVLYDYHQAIDTAKYIKAWEFCITQYPILRTAFNWDEDIIQVIYKQGKLNYQLHDISHLVTQQERDVAIETIQQEDRRQSFDLTKPALLRLHIIKQAEAYYTIIKTVHHNISDGWSGLLLMSGLQQHYQALTGNKKTVIKEDTAYLQAQEYISRHKSTVQDYWNKTIAGVDTANDINSLLSFPIDTSTYKQVENPAFDAIEITGSLYNELKNLSQKEGITVNVIVEFMWNKLLQVYSSSLQSIVGTTVSGRDIPVEGIEESVGLYINTLPLIINWDNENTVQAQLHEIQQKITEMNTNSFADLAKLQRNGERIFHSLFVFENYPYPKDLANISFRTAIEKVDYPLSIMAYEYNHGLTIKLEYDSKYLSEAKAKHHLATLQHILDQVISNPAKLQKHVMLLNQEEYNKIVYQWNETDKAYSGDKTICQLFQEQAERTPGNIALVYEGQQLTYKELNEKSNQLARHIRAQYQQRAEQELKPDTLIALFLDRSLEMIIGILAVLKAGGAYVPIDTNYPSERINYILEDTRTELILSQRHLTGGSQMQLSKDKIIHIDLSEELYNPSASANLRQYSRPTDLAYVMYTSGTTGKPKGVMLNHAGIVNRLEWMQAMYPLNPEDVVLQKTPYVFDVSVWEILWANWYGARIVLARPEGHKDSEYLDQLIREKGVTTLHFVPGMLDAYNFYLQQRDIKLNSTIKRMFCSGEALHKNTVQQAYLSAVNPSFRLHNLYGPTEASIDVTFFETTPDKNVCIGRPIQNSQTYILDPNGNPVPIGVIGELYIGGAGLARGYLNRPDLTAERFVPNPFATQADQEKGYTRLYKTGDLVSWSPDGDIEYIGRNDNQVKIRGYRMELGEIENEFSQIEGIKQSCVLAKERKTETGSTKYLVAYYVFDNTEPLGQSNILEKLSKKLPEYMVPVALIEMESFPLTVNGKLDKHALPDPDFNSPEQYVAPTTETETAICNIWQGVLGLQKVGITDNFFRIGGDSILSIQVSSRIRQAGFNCQVKDIFECRTIDKLAEHLIRKNAEVSIKSEQGTLSGDVSLLPIQQWFTEKVNSGEIQHPNYWNQSFLVKVPQLDISKLDTVIRQLVSYHDVFRVQFPGEDGPRGWKQTYQRQIDIPELKTLDISKHPESEVQDILGSWQSGFNLQGGPLFQAGYLYGYPDGSARIFFALHHMIVDAVSWRILADDTRALYQGKALPPKGSSYRQWVDTVKDYANRYPDETTWWEDQLRGMPDYDTTGEAVSAETEFIEFDRSLTGSLLQNASKAYRTEINDLLLTALAYALQEINHQDIQGITLEGHGREDIDATIDHSRTVGWFTSMFPVRLELQSSLRQSIQCIKDSLRSIPNKGIGFGVFATANGATYTHQELPPVSFNYLGQFDSQEGYWQIVAEGSGNSMHPSNADHNLVNINAMVSNGRLGCSIATRLGKEKTRQLGVGFKTHLTKIIEHCLEKLATEGSSYTPGDFKKVQVSQVLLDRLQSEARASQNEILHIYPATSLQQGFIYHVLSQAEDDAYRIQVLYDYHQAIDTAKYIKAWELCITQYPILRTAFNWDEDIIQVIYKQGKLNYQLHDISHLVTQQERDVAIETIQQEDRRQSFDLTKPALLRLHIIKQAEEYYTIIKTEHHSTSDGWSGPVLLSTLHQHYQALIENKRVSIKEDTAYIRAQEYIVRHKNTVQDYWNRSIAGADSANDINSLLSQPMEVSNYKQVENRAEAAIEIADGFYNKLKALSHKEGITLNVIIHFIWHKLLQVYSSSRQSLVGTTVSGRDIPVEGIEDSVGLYINTLPLIINWDNENTVLLQLHQIQQKITEMNTNSFADLVKLQRNGEQMFYSLFVYENYPLPKEGNAKSNISFRKAVEKVNYPLSLTAFEYNNSLSIKLQYDSKYLSEAKAKYHLATLQHILDHVISNPAKLHKHIRLLEPEEYNKIVYKWNETDKAYPKDKTLCQLFEEQTAKTPDNIALVYEGQHLTYKELNEKSNQLARHIRAQYQQRTKQELKPDALIALFLDRSLEMIIGILAVLKAGGAYVPIDTNYPPERINYILEDTRTELILSQRHLGEGNQLPLGKLIYIDLSETFYNPSAAANLRHYSRPTDLAYVMYTSGTTGEPKGVLVEHAAILSLVYNDYIKVAPKDVFAFLSSPVFDAATFEIWTPLLQGNRLVIPKEVKGLVSDIDVFKAFIKINHVSILWLTKTLFESIYAFDAAVFRDLSYLLTGGEALDRVTVNRLAGSSERPGHFLNGYGPTESTTFTCIYEINSPVEGSHVPIGKPINNRNTYILDAGNNPVPVGVIGELYIGGAGLARGYLNRPELTAERFIPNPFATQADREKGYTRLYKTGDLVRWLADGNIEFIGRNDDQVKIRGYRIELGEIEHALAKIAGIKQSCVLAREKKTESGTNKYLAAYYVTDHGFETLTEAAIVEALSKTLPEYMVPGALVKLASFPLTINGKLDKQALPNPDFSSSEEYVAPTTETEIRICNIWKSVLGLERVGITDNFFRKGGNSILAIQVSHRMSKALGYDVKIADVFRSKSIHQLLTVLKNTQALVKPYHLIYKPNAPDLVFIHPGTGGCEVYQGLADLLVDKFNCVGIDNYNIHNDPKIDSLNNLAHLYLSEFELYHKLEEPVNLLGWSSGGLITLEMAAILETRGFRNINVTLLDTIITDEYHKSQMNGEMREKSVNHFISLVRKSYEPEYVEKIVSSVDAELELTSSSISCHLKYAQVTLFKALQEDTRSDDEITKLLFKHYQTLEANHVEQLADHVKVINLDCHHGNILDKKVAVISDYLLYGKVMHSKTMKEFETM